jgi:hypothetical protein
MYKTLVLLAMALFLLLGSGCGRESRKASASNAQISLTAIPFPAAVGESRLVIRVTDFADTPVSDAALSIKGDMTHAGMVPVIAEVRGGDEDGYYNVPFEWTMAGDWIVTVEATLSDGTHAKERFDLSVVVEDEAVCTEDDPDGRLDPINSQE